MERSGTISLLQKVASKEGRLLWRDCMNKDNGIKTMFTNDGIRGTHTDIICNEGEHEERGAAVCENDNIPVSEKGVSEKTVSPTLKIANNTENEVNDKELRENINVKNENDAEINSSAENVLPNQQIKQDHLIEIEEVTKNEEQEKELNDKEINRESSLEKTTCQDGRIAFESSSNIKDVKDATTTTKENAVDKKDLKDNTTYRGKGMTCYSVDTNQVNLIRKSNNNSNQDQNNCSKTQNNDLFAYLMNNTALEFDGKSGRISYLGFSMQGYSHCESNIKCQDKCAIRVMGLSKQYVVAAIADGLGSCAFSDEGAAVAVSSALDEINKFFAKEENPTDDDIIFTLKQSMRIANENVRRYADQKEEELDDYYSTLTIVIYDGKDAFITHAGDDGVVVLANSGFYGLVTTRHKGDTVNSVIPLQGETNWEFMIVRDIVGVVMATDGVLDAFVKREREENRILFPFVKMITKECDEKNILEKYKLLFKTERIQKLFTDDITFIAMLNNETMKKTEFQAFDEKKWFRKNKERSEAIFKALYPDQKLTDDIADAWLDRDMELLRSLEQLNML